jgi:isoleucyl-tRNA synthetase
MARRFMTSAAPDTAKRFAPLPPDRSPVEAEAAVAAHWKSAQVFEKSLAQTASGPPFVFYEGPPTANGMPHNGHVLTRVMKDLWPRYKTMLGYKVERKAGWDTHGLPVEIEVEKTLGLEGKQDIEKYGVGPFVQKCRESVWKYKGEWERLTERIGFWLDMGDPYITYSREYVESVWWAIKKIDDLGLLYKGHKILPWCPRDMTGLSSHEVGQGYEEVEDPALTVAFKLTSEDAWALAWTTTPWTLLSNVALVVGPEIDYAFARQGERTYLLAAALVEKVLGKKGVEVLRTVKGKTLVGTPYEPLFSFKRPDGKAHVVVADAFVSTGDGTGIVHAAPAFGEDDARVCKANGLAHLNLVEPNGKFTAECGPYAGRWVKEADGDIARELKGRKPSQLVKQERYKHEYPHCWRCKTPLLYYARPAWYIETTKLKERLVGINQEIQWFPETIRDGRFGDFLANNKDWALSRERYWGTPLPVWECTKAGCEGRVVVDSIASLRKLNPTVAADLDPHRPGIDEPTVPCPKCGGTARRAKEVIDCWFDSGAMPFAQWGTPHVPGSQARFERNFPADFICEAIDQTRGWFYTLHAISTLLFDKPAYQRCVVLGHVLDAQGKKLSKKDKNYKSPDEVLDAHGADAMRWFFYSRMSPGQGVRFFDEAVRDARRTFLLKLLNVYKFFQEFASSDGFDPRPGGTPRPEPAEREPLDRWVLSFLHTRTAAVRRSLDAYEFNQAAVALEDFVDGLSNWYVRRSRDRGWRPSSPGDSGKWAFWHTLYEVQVTLAKLLAPFVPFIADELHGALVRDLQVAAPESVHLERYPDVDETLRDPALEARMGLARKVVRQGLEVRTASKLKVRQALKQAVVLLSSPKDEEDVRALAEVIADELNVKEVVVSREHDRYVTFDVRVNYKTLGQRLKARLNPVKAALAELGPAELARAAREGRSVVVALPDGTKEELLAEDLDVRLAAREGFAAQAERGVVVVVDTHVDAALEAEGLAREVQSRLQALRKELDLPFDAQLEVTLEGAEGALRSAVEAHRATIARETLSSAITLGPVSRSGVLLVPFDAGEVNARRARPLVAAAAAAIEGACAAHGTYDSERPFRALITGLSGPQQTTLRNARDKVAAKAGPVELEFDKPSSKFVPDAAVALDGQALEVAQLDEAWAAAREAVDAARRVVAGAVGGNEAVLLVGSGADLRCEVEGALTDVNLLHEAPAGATFLRVSPLDDWTLVLAVRVVA